MASFNRIATVFFDLVFKPFGRFSPAAGLIFISIVSGIFLLWIFKLTSNQKAIGTIKNRIAAGFLEIRLYQDDPVVMIKALGRILLSNLIYLRYSIVPVFFMLAPVAVLLIHANMFFGIRPVRPGETVLLSVFVKDTAKTEITAIKILLPDGLEEAAPPVRIAQNGEVDFALRARAPGRYEITLSYTGSETGIDLICGKNLTRDVPARTSGGAWTSFLNPGAAPLPSGSWAKEIRIAYPQHEINIAGLRLNWLVVFFIVSLAAGYSVKGLFGVEI
jgi:hypothetical protein